MFIVIVPFLKHTFNYFPKLCLLYVAFQMNGLTFSRWNMEIIRDTCKVIKRDNSSIKIIKIIAKKFILKCYQNL